MRFWLSVRSHLQFVALVTTNIPSGRNLHWNLPQDARRDAQIRHLGAVQAHLIVPLHTWTTILTDSRRNGQERHACYANIDSAHFSAHRNLLLENHRTTTSRGVSAPKRPETGRTRPVRKWATLVAAALFDYYSNWRYFISARIKSSGGIPPELLLAPAV